MTDLAHYLDSSARRRHASQEALDGSDRHPAGTFSVWTKRFGNNPTAVLLLHGGPAATHEYFEACDSYLRRRASSTTTTTSSARPTATSPTDPISGRSTGSSTRSSRCASHSAWTPSELLPARPLLGRHPRHRVRTAATSSTSRGS